jgi:hypothetical protein
MVLWYSCQVVKNNGVDKQIKKFDAALLHKACRGKNGACNQLVYLGDFCYEHAFREKQLQCKTSTIKNAGMGLFAVSRDRAQAHLPLSRKKVVFKRGEAICQYDGEVISEKELWSRYADAFAPYVIRHSNGTIIDCARLRSFASMANEAKGNQANARFDEIGRHVVLVATRDICDGDEIFTQYDAIPQPAHVNLSHKTTHQKANNARLTKVRPSQGTKSSK